MDTGNGTHRREGPDIETFALLQSIVTARTPHDSNYYSFYPTVNTDRV